MRLYGFFSIDGASVSGSAPLASFDDIEEELENIMLELGIVWAEVRTWYISVHSNGAKPH